MGLDCLLYRLMTLMTLFFLGGRSYLKVSLENIFSFFLDRWKRCFNFNSFFLIA